MAPQSYPQPEGDPDLGSESARDLKQLSDHIEKQFGAGMVLHEIRSDYVHIDLHVIPASAERPYHLVVTTGMSDRPMQAPEEFSDYKYAELYLALSPDWPLNQEAFKNEEIWWPFRHLKQTARFPHVHNTWIWFTHTIGNEEPLRPFTERVHFAGGILYRPQLISIDSCNVKIRDGKNVVFFPFVPLYESELRFAWDHGSDQLALRLKANNVTELVDPNRTRVI